MGRILLAFLIFLGGWETRASISYNSLTYKKKNNLITDGVFQGGQLGKTLDLIKVRRRYYKKLETDRWIFDLGDRDRAYRDAPPLVHIALNRLRRTLTIDLKKVKMNEGGEIIQVMEESNFVDGVYVIKDESSDEVTLQVLLNKSVAMEAFFLPNNRKNSRLVLDITSRLP